MHTYEMPQGTCTLFYYTYSFSLSLSLAVFVVVIGVPDIIQERDYHMGASYPTTHTHTTMGFTGNYIFL